MTFPVTCPADLVSRGMPAGDPERLSPHSPSPLSNASTSRLPLSPVPTYHQLIQRTRTYFLGWQPRLEAGAMVADHEKHAGCNTVTRRLLLSPPPISSPRRDDNAPLPDLFPRLPGPILSYQIKAVLLSYDISHCSHHLIERYTCPHIPISYRVAGMGLPASLTPELFTLIPMVNL